MIHFDLRALNIKSSCEGNNRERKKATKNIKNLNRSNPENREEKKIEKDACKRKEKRKRFFAFLSSHVFILFR